MRTIVRSLIVIACGVGWSIGWSAGNPAVSPQEAAQLFEGGNFENALPVYEALAAADPTSAVYAERLAFCLLVKFENLPDGAERTATFERARREGERAKSLGDDSNLLHVILERVQQPIGAAKESTMQAAEAAFSRGDLATALAGYQDIALRDPSSYEARLYAGDVYFVMKKLESAAEWFQQAIALDPDRETAYRYWGDALMQFNQQDAARQKFIDAVVAEPYSRRAWAGLQQWADRTGHELAHPRIEPPAQPQSASTDPATKDVEINVDLDKANDPADVGSWLVYSAHRVLWRTELFAKQFPDAKEYRHSLAEEVGAFESMLAFLDESKPPAELEDASLRNVSLLAKDGMLAAYVLISAADEGIAEDYAAYRAEHRDVLHAYMEKYVVRKKGRSD
ncbi:MAG TPA: tetratricopeptide repeat protein [Steroidobacteraceae bacterium]|nr:tetratricopeptide repeat protein [Steroidobacteraceae bacterium]